MENYNHKLKELSHARLLLEAQLMIACANREALSDGWQTDWDTGIRKNLSEAEEIEKEIRREIEPSGNEKAMREAIIEILDNELDRKAAIEFGGYTLDDDMRTKLQKLVNRKPKKKNP
jgi:hypothetical protein